MSGHAPGPWAYAPSYYKKRVECADGISVAYLIGEDAEVEANGRLIAAAPDLLEALTLADTVFNQLLGHVENTSALSVMALVFAAETKARAAIAKAEGAA